MKKFTIFTLVMFGAFGAFGQFNQGRMLVGGSLGFSTTTDKEKSGGTTFTDGKWTSFSLAPQFGYFVIDNLAVGASLDLSLSKFKDENDNDDDVSITSIEFQPFVRYYLPQSIFFQGQIGVGTQTYKYGSGTTSEFKDGVFSWALSAGYAYFLTDHVALEPMIGYGSTILKDKEDDSKDIDSGLFIRLGFQIYLGNKE